MHDAVFVPALDVLTILTAVAAAGPWHRGRRQPTRRISRFEDFNVTGINRIVVAVNRSALLNGKRALASAASALMAHA